MASAQQDGVVEVALDDISPEQPGGWGSYVAGVLWALRRDGLDVDGSRRARRLHRAARRGLSSSAALECAVAAAASDLFDLDLLGSAEGRARLAARCVEAENVIAGAPTGGMDQSASLLCDEAAALLLDCRSGETRHVPFDLDAAGYVLLVTDTRAEHALVDGQYAARRDACEQAAARTSGSRRCARSTPSGLDAALERLGSDEVRRRVRHVVTEIERVTLAVTALEAGDLDEVGPALRRLARVAARRLRGVVRGARRRDGDGARRTERSAPG